MRTEKEIVDMFVHVAACCENDNEPCPFFYSCSCTDDACREQWKLWLSKKGEIVHMDKNRILEIMFMPIKDSTDWGMDCENKNYGFFIDGVVTMTSSLLDEFDKKNCYDTREE